MAPILNPLSSFTPTAYPVDASLITKRDGADGYVSILPVILDHMAAGLTKRKGRGSRGGGGGGGGNDGDGSGDDGNSIKAFGYAFGCIAGLVFLGAACWFLSIFVKRQKRRRWENAHAASPGASSQPHSQPHSLLSSPPLNLSAPATVHMPASRTGPGSRPDPPRSTPLVPRDSEEVHGAVDRCPRGFTATIGGDEGNVVANEERELGVRK